MSIKSKSNMSSPAFEVVPKKQQALILSITHLRNLIQQNANNLSLDDNIMVFDTDCSFRLFQNDQTCRVQLVTPQDTRKGKIRVNNFNHMLSVDIEYSQQHGIKCQLHGCDEQTYLGLYDFPYLYNTNGFSLKQGSCVMIASQALTAILVKKHNQPLKYDTKSREFLHQPHNIIGRCRLCLKQQSQYYNDFMIAPCLCEGDQATVHYCCLRQQIEREQLALKMRSKGGNDSYYFRLYNCLECKGQYPKCIIKQEGHYTTYNYLFDFRPSSSQAYLVLSDSNYWYCITFQQSNQYSLGAHYSNSDISLYGEHSTKVYSSIKYEDNNFYITDLNSQDGTYLRLEKNFVLKEQANLITQNHFIQFLVVDK